MAEHQINKQAVVPYTAAQMYALVNDVRCYPEFLRGCVRAVILSQTEEQMVVQLHFMLSGFSVSFTTRNQCTKDARIDVALEEGPFTQLSGDWQFSDQEAGTGVVQSMMALRLSFEWAPGPWNFLFRSVFHKMSDQLVEAFCRRADVVYSAV